MKGLLLGGLLAVVVAAPVSAVNETAYSIDSKGWARFTVTLPEGFLYAASLELGPRSGECRVREVTVGDYHWPFTRRVTTGIVDTTPIYGGSQSFVIRTNCAWHVEIRQLQPI